MKELLKMIDWIKSKLKGEKHLCWECKNYIFNNMMNELYPNNHISCEGGGFCCPTHGVPYFIGRDKQHIFCYKFKFRSDKKLKKILLISRKKEKQNETNI